MPNNDYWCVRLQQRENWEVKKGLNTKNQCITVAHSAVQVCRNRGGVGWRRMHRLARTQTPGLGECEPGSWRKKCLGCCGTWLHTFAQPPAPQSRSFTPQELGCATWASLGMCPHRFPDHKELGDLPGKSPLFHSRDKAELSQERKRISRWWWLWGKQKQSL